MSARVIRSEGGDPRSVSIWDRPTSRRQILKGAVATGLAAAASPALVAATATRVRAQSFDPEKVVRVWIQGYGDPTAFNAELDAITAGFKEATGLTVKFEVQDWATAEQKWDLAMASGEPPDVGDMFYLPSRVAQGQGQWGPADLTDLVDAGVFGDWERFLPSTREESTLEGRIYAIPWRIDIRTWNHRSDLWGPAAPATLDELESMGLDVLDQPGIQAATSFFAQPIDSFHQAGAAWGLDILTPDYKASNLLDPGWAEAAAWLRDMVRKRVFLAESELDAGFDQVGALFSGTVAGIHGSGSILSQAEATAPQVAPLLVAALQPAGPAGARSLASCAQWSIFQNSVAFDEAVELVKYLTSTQVANGLGIASSTVSSDTQVQALDESAYNQVFYEQGQDVNLIDMPIVAWNEMRVFPDGPLNVMANRVYGTDDDIATILADADQEIAAILAAHAS